MRNLIKKNPRYSKRINYDALRDLFDGDAPTPDQKIDPDDDMYTLDPDKLDDEEGVVIEEGGGGVGMAPASKPRASTAPVSGAESEGPPDADAEAEEDLYGYGSDKGEAYGDWDVYEQEV